MEMPVTLTAKEKIQEYLYSNLFTEKAAESGKAIEKRRTVSIMVPQNERKNPSQGEIKKELDSFRKRMNKLEGDRSKEEKFLSRNGATNPTLSKEDRLVEISFKKAFKKKNQRRVSPYMRRAGALQEMRSGYKRKDLIPKLKYFLRSNVLKFSHKVGKRPFLGHTDISKRDMIEAVENYFRKAQK